MRELFPNPADDVDPVARYESDHRPPPADRPWLLVNMVTSVDGATAVDGRSGALGSAGDHLVFHTLRAVADVVLAGAGTVRAEQYGPPRTDAAAQQRRAARGQAPHPRLAVLTGRLDLDLGTELFAATPSRPIIITTSAVPAARRREAAEVADVIEAGDQRVDVALAVRLLGELGVSVVTCEGGPTINGELLAADLVDEWCQTLSAVGAGGTSARAAAGPDAGLRTFTLDRALLDGDTLLLRYLRSLRSLPSRRPLPSSVLG